MVEPGVPQMPEALDRDALVDELRRARRALEEAIRLVETGWERAPSARAGDDQPWSSRTAAEHAIGADLGFTAMIARALELSFAAAAPPAFPTPEDALEGLATAASSSEPVLAAVTDQALGVEVEFAGHVGTLLRFAAGHLREHARQVAGLR